MSAYLVLARKYRSTTFEEVVGQEPVTRTLQNAISSGRIAHAFLFTGTRGVGKTTVARILAKALNCMSSEGPTPKPCNKCDACKAISRGDDMDVVEIDGASNRGIDEIRDLRANAVFRPSRCRFKIYYIDEVHMLTKEAFNALLKTLEEPPEHVKFIFATTESEKVPATILSRCQRFDFRNIPTRRIADHLRELCDKEKVAADDDALFRVARAGAGSMRDALSLLDQLLSAGAGSIGGQDVVRLLGTPAEERVLAMAAAAAGGNAAAAIYELAGVLDGGVSVAGAMGALGEVFRNMMLARVCGEASELIELPDTQRKTVGELAGRFSTAALVHAVGLIQGLLYRVKSSALARALAEAALVRLAEADKFIDPEAVAERLEAMASGQPPAQKKNPPLTADARGSHGPTPRPVAPIPAGPAESAAPPSAPVQAELPPIKWNGPWLSANWKTVVDHLFARRQMRLAGTMRVARVVSLENHELVLGFDPASESIRRSFTGELDQQARTVLGELAGEPVRCKYVALPGAPAVAANGAAPNLVGLNSAQKTDLMKDPAVKTVLDAFGGDVADMRVDSSPQAQPPAADEVPPDDQ